MLALLVLLVATGEQPKRSVRQDKTMPDRSRVGDVKSEGMLGGVTAGVVGNVQQTYTLPTLVRGPLLAEFKTRFVVGARLQRALYNISQTDAEFDALFKATDDWINTNYMWLNKDVSPWAAERFVFRLPSSYTYFLPGRDQRIADMRSSCINSLQSMLQNLDQLMREPSIYADAGK